MSWPVYFKEQLTIGNEESPVGVATLWTPKDAVLKTLEPSLYAVAGQLYSKEGVNWIIRNILANPRLHYLVLCGEDRSGGGAAMIDFIENGVDEKFHTRKMAVQIHQEIRREALERVRQNLKIIDLRNINEGEKVAVEIQSLELSKPSFGEPEIFPLPQQVSCQEDNLPTDPSVFKLRSATVASAWPLILKMIMKFGSQKGTDYGGTQRELINLAAVIYEEDPDNLLFAEYFPFTRQEFENYAPQILTANPITEVEYTYGQRLKNYDGIDQISDGLIAELKRSSASRRALAVTWKVKQDLGSKQPPCLVTIQGLAQRGFLHLVALFRSSDMYAAWPQNTLALRRLQGIVAKEVGFTVGTLTTISASAHIYERDYASAAEIIKQHGQTLQCEFDPRGNFIIRLEDGLIKVVHQSPQGENLSEYSAQTAKELLETLDREMIVSQVGHALDLGLELAKVEMCLRLGKNFSQDTPLVKLL